MLQSLREKTSGWIAGLIIAAVGVPFAFFGIEHYFQARVPTHVAKVGDVEISGAQFAKRVEEIARQAQRTQGQAFDPGLYQQPSVKRQILEKMIDEELLIQAAARARTEASNAWVRKEIQGIVPFQKSGKFDPDQYRLMLQAQNLDISGFEEKIRRSLSIKSIDEQIEATPVVTNRAIDNFIRLRDQTRDFKYLDIPVETAVTAEPTPQEIETYYKSHQDAFKIPEKVSLKYVELNATEFKVPDPDEAALKADYEQQKKKYITPEQRLASHILVNLDKAADEMSAQAALKKAEEYRAQLKQGKDFATLAKEASDDFGSKAGGGDLGWLEKGVTDPAFEKALFAMKAGDVSDPVKGAEGYHIISLREIRPEKTKAFEEVREELKSQFVANRREQQYNELSGKLIDKIYEDTAAIEDLAKAFGLETKSTELFDRTSPGQGISIYPQVVNAAFSDQVLQNGNISDSVEIGPNHMVIVQLKDRQPEAVKPLAAVNAEIVAALKVEMLAKATESKAKALEKKLLEGAALETLAAEINGKVVESKAIGRNAANHDRDLLTEVFKLPRPQPGNPQRALVAIPGNRFALVELAQVTDGDPGKTDATLRDSIRGQFARDIAADERKAFLQALRANTKIEVAESRL